MKKILFTIILLIILLFLYGSYIEPNRLKINEYEIKNELIPSSFNDLKIVQFSDLLYDKDNKKLDILKKKINKLKPDIIIFTGNLFNNEYTYKDEDVNNLKDFLNNINAELYKYAVIGNNDKKLIDTYKDILYETDFILLDNQSTLLFYKDETPINIIGITDNNFNDINSLLQSDIEYNYCLAITNKPDNVIKLNEYNINAVISGHSLGGIINIPFYGGIIKMEGSKTYINSYYKVNNTDLYISNGLGYKKFNFRLFNAPSINVYRFSN